METVRALVPFVRRRCRREPRPGRRAFTLVELLVVIGMIPVLAGILVPSLAKARETAQRTAGLSNMRQLGQGLILYLNENKNNFPSTGKYTSGSTNYDEANWVWWQTGRDFSAGGLPGAMGGLLNRKAFICPSDDVLAHHAHVPDPAYPFSYVMNSRMTRNGQVLSGGPYYGDTHDWAQKVNEVISPATKIIFYEEDESTIDDGNGALDTPNLLAGRHDRADANSANLKITLLNGSTKTIKNAALRGNACFIDGHAETLPRSDAHHPMHYEPMWENKSLPQ